MAKLWPAIAITVGILMLHPAHLSAREVQSYLQRPQEVTMETLTRQQQQDLECMTRNIYHEARGTNHNNQLAVALVVMNRHRITGQTLCQVIYSPGQFAWTRRRPGVIREPDAWDRARSIAYMVMFSGDVHDITRGATHFHERNILPDWSRRSSQRIVIGSHVFVRVRSFEQFAQAQ